MMQEKLNQIVVVKDVVNAAMKSSTREICNYCSVEEIIVVKSNRRI
ncbi:MAG: hypothetical protein ACR5KW_00585 [Wolbachia sp.]